MVNNKSFLKKLKGQTFSTEMIVVIVVVLIGALFLVAQQVNENSKLNPKIDELNKKANENSKLIVEEFKKEGIIDSENKVDIDKLSKLNEEQLKEKLGITGDFAIVFEKDGNLVKIDPENNINCIGSNKIVVNGVSCK